jgi:hypothetical protein
MSAPARTFGPRERCVNQLEHWRGTAAQYDKRVANYRMAVLAAALMI